jgi:rSAM/selenodomain-associated transferase 2
VKSLLISIALDVPLEQAPAAEDPLPKAFPTVMTISVIIPTYNEATTIQKLIQFIREHGSAIMDIIVVDAGSTDGTAEKADAAGSIVMTSPVKSRAVQMNLGARIARGDILYFVHADVLLVRSFSKDIQSAVDAGFSAGCYRFVFDSGNVLLKLNAYCTRYRGIMCRGGDQTLFITRKLFYELEGFNEYFSIMEDYDIIRRIRRKNKFTILDRSVTVSSRKYRSNSWARVQLANFIAFMLFFLDIHPDRIKTFYKMAINSP